MKSNGRFGEAKMKGFKKRIVTHADHHSNSLEEDMMMLKFHHEQETFWKCKIAVDNLEHSFFYQAIVFFIEEFYSTLPIRDEVGKLAVSEGRKGRPP